MNRYKGFDCNIKLYLNCIDSPYFLILGPGKSPSEWAEQQEEEMANNPGVIYNDDNYHEDGMGAELFLVHCEDCIT